MIKSEKGKTNRDKFKVIYNIVQMYILNVKNKTERMKNRDKKELSIKNRMSIVYGISR